MDKGRGVSTTEGVKALDDCIRSLLKRGPVGPLSWNRELFLASREHTRDLGQLGLYGHTSSRGMNMYDRIRNYTNEVPGMLAENVGFGSQNPLEAVILMLIDDGDQE